MSGWPFAVMESDADYFMAEYGVTAAETVKAGKAMKMETARARRAGTLREINTLADLKP